MDHPLADSHYDLLILGAGPIGLACGIEAKKAGLNYLILEKGALCNSIYNYPVNMTFFSTSERLELAGIPLCRQEQSLPERKRWNITEEFTFYLT